LGLAFLMLLAGYETDLKVLRGPPLTRATISWGATLVLGLLVGALLAVTDFVVSELLVGLCLTTTALGVLVPMMHDRGLGETRFGRYVMGAGTLGEFAPIIAVTILLTGDQPLREVALLTAFIVVAVVGALMAARPQPPNWIELLQKHFHTSSQLPVRIAVLLLSAMVFLAAELGLDTILGAFTAGVLLRILRHPSQASELDSRLEGIGFGFLVPVFFIVSGMHFDAGSLFNDPATLLRVPIFLGLMLLVRGTPVLLVYRGLISGRNRVALAIMQSTALPLVVVITGIGVETGTMRPQNATALVAAAMLSVLIFPLLGFGLMDPEPVGAPGDEPRGDHDREDDDEHLDGVPVDPAADAL
jgi:Kef-type K+ transport system membrane component KefB